MQILIVEDELLSRIQLMDILGKFGSCHVAVNGIEAIEAVKRCMSGGGIYDLICLDIMLPLKDGQQTLREIRQKELERGYTLHDSSKIIMITSLDDLPNYLAGEGLWDGYLLKPIKVFELYQELKRLKLLDATDNQPNWG